MALFSVNILEISIELATHYIHDPNKAGWTGVIARAMQLFATLTPAQVLKGGAKTKVEKAVA